MSNFSLGNAHALTLASLMTDEKFTESQACKAYVDADGNVSKLTGEFVRLHGEFSDKLDEYKKKNEELKQRIQNDKINPEENAEIAKFHEEYSKLLQKLNESCQMELSKSSKSFLKKISAANSEFLEDIICLAQVYKEEENVDFAGIKKMYDVFYETYKQGYVHYRSCSELKRLFGDNPALYEQQLQFHLLAAEAYDEKYIQDETLQGYSSLKLVKFLRVNNLNSQSATRARDYLVSFAMGALRTKEIWKIVQRRQGDALVSSEGIVGCVKSGDLVDNALQNMEESFSNVRYMHIISQAAKSSAVFLSRLSAEATEAYASEKGLTEAERRERAVKADWIARLKRANVEKKRLSQPLFKTVEEFMKYTEETKASDKKRDTTASKSTSSSGGGLSSSKSTSSSGGGLSSSKSTSSSGGGLSSSKSTSKARRKSVKTLLDTSSGDESDVMQAYSDEDLNDIAESLVNLNVDERIVVPESTVVFERAMDLNAKGARVVTDNGCLRTVAKRDYKVGEILVQVAVVVKLDEKYDCDTFGAHYIGNSVWLELPGLFDITDSDGRLTVAEDLLENAGVFFPNYPLMYTHCQQLEVGKEYCNLHQLENSTLEVIREIKVGEFMMSYSESSIASQEICTKTVQNAKSTQLKYFVSLVMDCERDVFEKIYLEGLKGNNDVKKKFPDIADLISQHMMDSLILKTAVTDLTWLEIEQLVNENITVVGSGDVSTDGSGNAVSDLNASGALLKRSDSALNLIVEFFTAVSEEDLHLEWKLSNCDIVFAIKDFPLVQRYLCFESIRNLVFDARIGYSDGHLKFDFREDLVNRMVEFWLTDRFCVLKLPHFYAHDPYGNNEYEFVELLPVSFKTCEIESFPYVKKSSSRKRTNSDLSTGSESLPSHQEDEYFVSSPNDARDSQSKVPRRLKKRSSKKNLSECDSDSGDSDSEIAERALFVEEQERFEKAKKVVTFAKDTHTEGNSSSSSSTSSSTGQSVPTALRSSPRNQK